MEETSEPKTLVVVSKVKKFVRELSGMNTGADAIAVLSEKVAQASRRAIENARTDGRKTLKGRDF